MPVGSSFLICSSSTRTRLMTSIEFAFGRTQMPMKTAFCPENRTPVLYSSAKNICFLHTADRGQTRLDQTHQVVSNFVRLKDVGGETEISGSKLRISRLDCNDRNFRFGRQVAPDGIDPRANVGESLVSVV